MLISLDTLLLFQFYMERLRISRNPPKYHNNESNKTFVYEPVKVIFRLEKNAYPGSYSRQLQRGITHSWGFLSLFRSKSKIKVCNDLYFCYVAHCSIFRAKLSLINYKEIAI